APAHPCQGLHPKKMKKSDPPAPARRSPAPRDLDRPQHEIPACTPSILSVDQPLMSTLVAPFAAGGPVLVDDQLARRLLTLALSQGGDYADLYFEYRAGADYV